MALPLAFAACTSEEIIENAQDQNLDARKALGEVELVFSDEVNSRMTAEGGNIGFVVGDGVGACLVDVYSKNSDAAKAAVAINNYLLTDYIQTNYQYKYDGSSWATTARMVEGNYVFYAPYNGNHLARTAIKTGIVNQELTLAEDGSIDAYSAIDGFLKSGQPAYVGYKFLKAAGQDLKVSVDMKPIYAYPLITLDNSDEDAEDNVTITKIAFLSSKLVSEASITVGNAANIAAKNAEGVVGNLFNEGATAAKNGSWATNKYMIGNKTSNVIDEANAKKANVITVTMPEGAYTVKAGEKASFHVVLPAEAYTDLTAYVYTSKGEAYKTVLGTTLSGGKIYPNAEYNTTTGNAYEATKGKKFTVDLMENTTAAPTIVSTTQELVDAVATAGDDIALTLGSEEVKLTSEVVKAANPSITYTINNAIAVVGGTDAALNVENFEFSNGATIESGKVALATTTAATVTVKKGAELQALSSTITAKVSGHLTVGSSAADEAAEGIALAGLEVTTGATVTINKWSSIPTDVKNAGTITNYAANLPAILNGTWVNEGKIVLDGIYELRDGSMKNNGTIDAATENPTFRLIGSTLENIGTLNIAATGGNLVFKKSTLTTGATKSTLKAKGLFTGAAIKALNAEARIELYDGYQAVNAFTVATGGVLAYVKETWDDTGNLNPVMPTNANTLVVKDLTIKDASTLPVANIEFSAGATFNVNSDITISNDSKITLAGSATIKGIKTITVAATKKLDIIVPKQSTLSISAVTFAGSGKVNIIGYAATGDDKSTLENNGATLPAGVVTTTTIAIN